MMLGGDSKKLAQIIASRIPGKGGAQENAESFQSRAKEVDDGLDDGEVAAAEEILAAFDSKNPRRLALALKDAFEIFDRYSDSEGPEPESDG